MPAAVICVRTLGKAFCEGMCMRSPAALHELTWFLFCCFCCCLLFVLPSFLPPIRPDWSKGVEYYQRQREPNTIMFHAVQDAEIKKKVVASVQNTQADRTPPQLRLHGLSAHHLVCFCVFACLDVSYCSPGQR